MKTTKVLLIANIAALALIPSLSMAQGFGHYPQKGAYALKPLSKVETVQQIQTRDTIPMSCPKCKDTFKSVSIPFSKGMRINETRIVTEHLCPNCVTTVKTEGMGKNVKNKLVHVCNACGSEDRSCCETTKNGNTTAGM